MSDVSNQTGRSAPKQGLDAAAVPQIRGPRSDGEAFAPQEEKVSSVKLPLLLRPGATHGRNRQPGYRR